MGITQNHGMGWEQRFYATVESTYGTFVRPTDASALRALKMGIDYAQERADRMDVHGSRSLIERVTRRKKVTWTLDGYLIPSGTAGTAPDMAELYQSVWGTETVTPATSVVYSLSDSQSAHQSLCLHRWCSVLMEAMTGCVATQMKLTASGTDSAKVSFSGFARDMILTGYSTLNGAMVASDQMIVQTADATAFEVNSIVKIASNDNTDAGFLISVHNGATNTIQSAISADSGSAVVPWAPNPAASDMLGGPIAGITGSLTIDGGSALPVTSFELTLDAGIKPIEDEAFQAVVTDYVAGRRSVTGSIGLRLRRNEVIYLATRKSNPATTYDLVVTIGSGAGTIVTVDVDRAELEFSAVEFPDDGSEATVTIPFRAIATTAGANEATLTFT